MTPERQLLARIFANNKNLCFGAGEMDQAELDLLKELRPKLVKPDVVYDLAAMKFDPDTTHWSASNGVFFWWDETPEGFNYWEWQDDHPTQEGRDKIAAMREQFEREKK